MHHYQLLVNIALRKIAVIMDSKCTHKNDKTRLMFRHNAKCLTHYLAILKIMI